MNRSLLITIHMYLSAFFAPLVFLVAVSGGLYLLGVKGSVEQSVVFESNGYMLDSDAADVGAEVDALLAAANIEGYSYDYVAVKGNTWFTRPTSREHYIIEVGDVVKVSRARPSLQKSLLELHMGHGPSVFRTFQKFFALGMVLIVATGLWLGLSAERLAPRTVATFGVGLAAALALALL